jgi:hypothetical protein
VVGIADIALCFSVNVYTGGGRALGNAIAVSEYQQVNNRREYLMANDDAALWGELGEQFWLESGDACNATPQQIRFAAARFAGATRVKAAQLAGYSGDDKVLRSVGSRADDSKAVENLITMAKAAAADVIKDPVSAADARNRIGQLVSCPDAGIALKASELFLKMEQLAAVTADTSKMTMMDAMLVTVLMGCAAKRHRPELWPLVWMEMFLPQDRGWTPMIRQMAPYLKQHHPALWAGARKHLPDDFLALESGPVLPVETILEISLKNMPALVLIIDSNTDPDDRKTTCEDLRRIGLMEMMVTATA